MELKENKFSQVSFKFAQYFLPTAATVSMTQFSVPWTCWRWRIWISGSAHSKPFSDNTSIPKWLGAILLLNLTPIMQDIDLIELCWGGFSLKNLLNFFFRSDKFLHKLKTLTTLPFFFLIQIIVYRHQRMGSKIKTEAVLAVEQATSWNGLHLKFLPSSAKTSEKRLPMNQQSCIQQWQEFTSWEPLKWLEEN